MGYVEFGRRVFVETAEFRIDGGVSAEKSAGEVSSLGVLIHDLAVD